MKFFKFVNDEDKSISQSCYRIHYVKGNTIEVKDANPNSTVQCGSGIHCILFEDTKPINTWNILFGPRVAILEAEKEDVIYYSEDGKCRLRKCKVLDVYDIKELPKELKNGRGSSYFAGRVLELLYNVKFDEWAEILDGDIDGYYTRLLLSKLDKYYRDFEDFLIERGWLNSAVQYSIKHKKYNNDSIKNWVENNGNSIVKMRWACAFDPDKIDELEKELLAKLSADSYSEIDKVIEYAIEFNRINDTIIDFILNNHNYNYSHNIIIHYIRKFKDYPEIEKITELSLEYAYCYCLEKKGNVSDKISGMVKYNDCYSVAYILNIEDSGHYNNFDDIYSIIAYLDKYGANDKFLDSILLLKYITGNVVIVDFTKFRTFQNSNKMDALFIKTKPSFGKCIEYCNYINSINKILLDYIKTFDTSYIIETIEYVKCTPQIKQQILDEYTTVIKNYQRFL